jgi:hypothetical protein
MRIALYAGPVAALMYFLQVGHVFDRLSLPGRAAQAVVIGWLFALSLNAQMTVSNGIWTSEQVLARAPSFQFGSPGLLAVAGSQVAYRLEAVPFAWFFLAPSLFAVLLHVSLLLHLVRAGRRQAAPAGT